jgi:hypothetical protein
VGIEKIHSTGTGGWVNGHMTAYGYMFVCVHVCV